MDDAARESLTDNWESTNFFNNLRRSMPRLIRVYRSSDPLWRCWVAHARYVRLLLQHSLTHAELVTLDRLIYEHHELFLAAEEYGPRLFKPKNHFACHFPSDILNHGPVRNYWCMRFEALNQLFKSFAKTGSFRNTCGRCADMWTMTVAIARDRGTDGDAGKTCVIKSSGWVAKVQSLNKSKCVLVLHDGPWDFKLAAVLALKPVSGVS